MDEARSSALCGELRELVTLGPGSNDHAMSKVRELVGQYRNLGTYVDEKAGEVLEDFEMWFTPRRWARYGDASGFAIRVHTSITKLENAASTWLRRRPPES